MYFCVMGWKVVAVFGLPAFEHSKIVRRKTAVNKARECVRLYPPDPTVPRVFICPVTHKVVYDNRRAALFVFGRVSQEVAFVFTSIKALVLEIG